MADGKPSRKSREKAPQDRSEAGRGDPYVDAFAAAIGGIVRTSRAKRGMTRRQLAEQSGTSERYLAQIEGGQGNPSVIVLKAIAEALDLSIVDLLPRTDGRSDTLERIVDVLRRMPQSELPAIADLIEGRAALATDRARRIALVGLRGAGKSTLGKRLAAKLGAPFIQLDRMIEREYGASSVPDFMAVGGIDDLPPLRRLLEQRHRQS
jgi:XRE family aerobic/anaerobic benzoate catabolism transcriptional regulator